MTPASLRPLLLAVVEAHPELQHLLSEEHSLEPPYGTGRLGRYLDFVTANVFFTVNRRRTMVSVNV